MKEHVTDWITWITGVLALLFILFVLSAPPVMISIARARGAPSFPSVYQPFITIIESDYGGPLLWYFNDVWHAGIELIGEESGPTLRMVLFYVFIGLALFAVAALPFWRRRRWRLSS